MRSWQERCHNEKPVFLDDKPFNVLTRPKKSLHINS